MSKTERTKLHEGCPQGASQWILRLGYPLSQRAAEDATLLVEIQRSYEDSYGIYGSPRIHRGRREPGIRCGVKRVARPCSMAILNSTRGYRRPRHVSGKPSIAALN